MFEQDDITRDDFKNWSMPAAQGPAPGTRRAVDAPGENIVVKAKNFYFDPAEIKVKQGEPAMIVLKNEGAVAHNLTIGQLDAATETVPPGGTAKLSFTPGKRALLSRCLGSDL